MHHTQLIDSLWMTSGSELLFIQIQHLLMTKNTEKTTRRTIQDYTHALDTIAMRKNLAFYYYF